MMLHARQRFGRHHLRVGAALFAIVLHGCASGGAVTTGGAPVTVATQSVGGGAGGGLANTTIVSSNVGQSTRIAAPLEVVWARMPAVYEALGLPLSMKDDAARRLGNSQIKVRRALNGIQMRSIVDCGSDLNGEKAESYEIRLTIESVVAAGDDASSATVTTMVSGVGRSPQYNNSDVNCSTKGELERRIARGLRTQLGLPEK